MITKIKCVGFVIAFAMLIEACGGGSPATEVPVSEAPAATEDPAATEAPAAPEPSEPPAEDIDRVVILVVDNFSEKNETKDDSDLICSVLPDGFGEFKGGELGRTINGIPHGIFVYNEVLNQITAAGFTEIHGVDNLTLPPDPNTLHPNAPGGPDWRWRVDRWQKQDVGEIIVVAVDTNGLRSNSIFSNIEEAIDVFSAGADINNVSLPPIGPDRFVVNMSFGFVPCEPITYIRPSLIEVEKQIPNLCTEEKSCDQVDTVAELKSLYDMPDGQGNKTGTLYKYINDPLSYDVEVDQSWRVNEGILETHLKSYFPDQPNQLDDATFQAFVTHLVNSPDDLQADDESVQRFRAENLIDPIDPNNPGWLMQIENEFNEFLERYPGALFVGAAGNSGLSYPFIPAALGSVVSISSVAEPTRDACQGTIASDSNCGEIKMDGNGYIANNPTVLGTSFAAPKFSFYAALYLLRGGAMTCATDPNVFPVLGYSNGSGPWNNLPLDDQTVNRYCVDFPFPTPIPTP